MHEETDELREEAVTVDTWGEIDEVPADFWALCTLGGQGHIVLYREAGRRLTAGWGLLDALQAAAAAGDFGEVDCGEAGCLHHDCIPCRECATTPHDFPGGPEGPVYKRAAACVVAPLWHDLSVRLGAWAAERGQEQADAILAWFDQAMHRCMAMVPAGAGRRRFLKGALEGLLSCDFLCGEPMDGFKDAMAAYYVERESAPCD